MRRWTLPVAVGLWVAGCGFFDFPAPERAREESGGEAGTPSSGGTSGATGGSSNGGGTAGAAGAGEGGTAGTSEGGTAGTAEGGTAGAAGAGDGGTAGAGEGGTSGSSTGGTGGDAGGGAAPTEPVMTGLKLWLDATSLADGPLSIWPNRIVGVDAEPDATQPGSAPRPVVATFDGRKGVQFDGTRWMTFAEGFETWSAGLTFFLVARFDAPALCTEIFQVSNGVEVDDISFQSDVMLDDPGVFHFEVAAESLPTGPGVIGGLEPMLAAAVMRPPDSASIFINTVPGNARSNDGFLPANVARTENFLGSGVYLNCDPFEGVIFELLLYNRGLSEANVALVSEYLQAKWGCCDG